MNLQDSLNINIAPELAVIVPALLILGMALKNTPKCPDWLIAWIMLGAGVGFGVATVGVSVSGVANGLIAAGGAISTHQLWKQTKSRDSGTQTVEASE